MPWIILAIIISYFLGSIPTGYIFGRLLKGIDIRKAGSGNVGATNVLRVLGKREGVAVLILDMFKGFVVVVFLADFVLIKSQCIPDEMLRVILGLSAVLGHNWTVFLNFKGGKGVATTIGILLGLAVKVAALRLVIALVIITWFLVFIFFKIVSIASIVAALSLPVYMAVFKVSKILLYSGLVLAVFIILRHKSNLKRILQGKESRIKF